MGKLNEKRVIHVLWLKENGYVIPFNIKTVTLQGVWSSTAVEFVELQDLLTVVPPLRDIWRKCFVFISKLPSKNSCSKTAGQADDTLTMAQRSWVQASATAHDALHQWWAPRVQSLAPGDVLTSSHVGLFCLAATSFAFCKIATSTMMVAVALQRQYSSVDDKWGLYGEPLTSSISWYARPPIRRPLWLSDWPSCHCTRLATPELCAMTRWSNEAPSGPFQWPLLTNLIV